MKNLKSYQMFMEYYKLNNSFYFKLFKRKLFDYEKITKIFFFFTYLFTNCTLIVENSPAQWIQQQSGVTSYLRDIEFINDQTGWVCGDGGTILKTTNAGTNWIIQNVNVPGKPLFGIHPVNENVVYCVGWFETIIKTTNGGEDWIIIENAPFGEGRSYFSCFFIDEYTGWIGSTNPAIRKTTNGGKSFQDFFANGIARDLYFKDHANGLGVGWSANIFSTNDGGIIWNSNLIAGTGDLERISVLSDGLTAYTIARSSQRNPLYKSTNFGETWDSISNVAFISGALQGVTFSSQNTGWVYSKAPGTSQIYKTTDGGASWIIHNSDNIVARNDAFALNDSIVWTCGGLGTIYYTKTGGDTTVGIVSNSIIIPENFELKQNYPNPFNSQTTIPFQIIERGNYILEVIDPLGRIVKTIFNENLDIGDYKYNFNSDLLSSGIYFYRLFSNKYSRTKSMMIIK